MQIKTLVEELCCFLSYLNHTHPWYENFVLFLELLQPNSLYGFRSHCNIL